MFFVMLLIGFASIGSILAICDIVFPGFFFPFVAVGIKMTGLILIWCGIGVYLARATSTGGYLFIDLPNPNNTLLFHIGNSGARILKAAKAELNSLLVKKKKHRMRIKDMGHGISVAGHEVQVSCQTAGFTFPLWLLDLIDKWKGKYGMRNKEEWQRVYDQLKEIKDSDTGFILEKKLLDIDILKPVMADEKKKRVLLSMSGEQLRNMKELLFDGSTVNAKAYLDWDESANPYDNESIISRSLAHRAEQRTSYRFGGATDWAKIVVPAAIILIMGAIAYQIFGG